MGLTETIAEELGGVAASVRGFFARKAVRRLIVFFAVLLVLSVLGTIIVATSVKTPPQKKTVELFTPEKINSEMIFLPNEPDFLPEVLFEQKPKEIWREEDAAPFWSNPLDAGEAFWQERLSSSLDELLERIP